MGDDKTSIPVASEQTKTNLKYPGAEKRQNMADMNQDPSLSSKNVESPSRVASMSNNEVSQVEEEPDLVSSESEEDDNEFKTVERPFPIPQLDALNKALLFVIAEPHAEPEVRMDTREQMEKQLVKLESSIELLRTVDRKRKTDFAKLEEELAVLDLQIEDATQQVRWGQQNLGWYHVQYHDAINMMQDCMKQPQMGAPPLRAGDAGPADSPLLEEHFGSKHFVKMVRRMTAACQQKDKECTHMERVVIREVNKLKTLSESMVDYQLTQVKVKKYLNNELLRCQREHLDGMGRPRGVERPTHPGMSHSKALAVVDL